MIYEIQATSCFKLRFFSRDVSKDDSTFFYNIVTAKGSNPLVIFHANEEKKVVIIDCLMKKKPEEKDKDDSAAEKSGSEANGEDSGAESSDYEKNEMEEKILYGAVMCDEMVMEERDIKLNTQPQLVDNVLMFSNLNIDNKYYEIFMKEMPKDEEEEEEDEDDSAAEDRKLLSGLITINVMNNPNAWRTSFSYPLLAAVNTERADEMVIAHMANGAKEQALLRLKLGQFISYVDSDNESTFTDITFLSYDSRKSEILLFVLSLENSFKKGALLKEKDWRVKRQVLSDKFNKLYEMRDKLRSVKLLMLGGDDEDSDDKVMSFLCQTDEDIFFITEKGMTEVFTTKGDFCLANHNMIFAQSGYNYYITEELSSQTHFIYEFKASYNNTSKKFTTSSEKVFTFSTGTVVAI